MRLSEVDADRSAQLRNDTVGGALQAAAAAAPEGLALVEGGPDRAGRRRWTFAELLAGSEDVARALAGRYAPGEHVAVWASNSPEWVLLEFGMALAGLVMVTVNPALQPRELEYVLGQSRSVGLFYERSHRGNPMAAHFEQVRPKLAGLRDAVALDDFEEFVATADPAAPLPKVDPESPAQVQYTSGTTGAPKGALLHHRGITNNARLGMEVVGLDAGGVYGTCMPLFHTGGCVLGVLGPVQRLAAIALLPYFDPGLMLAVCEEEGVTEFLAVPTMLIAMMEHPSFAERDLRSLNTVLSGGATVPAEIVRRIEKELGVDFSIMYGQTEASPVITMTRPADSAEDKATTLGTALFQTAVKIVDPGTGETVPVGTTGELCAKGYNVMLGYYDMPDKTAETIDADGWLHTGDLATMDDRGYFRIAGRLKDMIIRGGENIYPREIEEALYEHPSVADVAVVGLPDPTWGEIVGAFVRDTDPDHPAADAELRQHLRERLSPQKTPAVWVHIREFPLTPSGKIQKFVLRDQWLKERS
jgi:fatty-acyl-CoA synthase